MELTERLENKMGETQRAATYPWYLADGERKSPLGCYTVFYGHAKHYGASNQICSTVSLDHARLIAEAGTVLHTTGRTPRELADDNAKLRYLLACAYSGAKLYGDDGQLQDSSMYPLIDYVRMTPDQIEAAFHERARAALARNGTE